MTDLALWRGWDANDGAITVTELLLWAGNSPDTLLTKIFIHSLLAELSERNTLLTFVKLNLPASHVDREDRERGK